MTSIDYAKVAARYENNKIRHQIPLDPLIATWPTGVPRVLDLACGTGLYLEAQTRQLGAKAAVWHGVDASPAMLGVAQRKGGPWDLRVGRAEAIPFSDAERLDYVVCRFAFHHFIDKDAALGEIDRVLQPGGAVRFENIVAEDSADFWLYRYFPGALVADKQRFWPLEKLEAELSRRGYACTRFGRREPPRPAGLFLAEARNRETSQLHLIDEQEYREGLTALEADWAAEPGRLVEPGLAIGGIVAWKSALERPA